jgi:catechol 2,3-dioxygenase-like lactoylglutathione lyase family enzyme
MRQNVTPYLLYEDGEAAVDFLTAAFGFREIDRTTGAAGGMHVEMEMGGNAGRVYLGSPGGTFGVPRRSAVRRSSTFSFPMSTRTTRGRRLPGRRSWRSSSISP